MVCFAGNVHFSGKCPVIALAFSEVSTEKVGTFGCWLDNHVSEGL